MGGADFRDPEEPESEAAVERVRGREQVGKRERARVRAVEGMAGVEQEREG